MKTVRLIIVIGLLLGLTVAPAEAEPVKPNLRQVLMISRDGFVGVIWDIIPHQPPLEWLAQASFDANFAQIVSSSGWIQPRVGFFHLPVPRGVVFVRVGSRETGGQEIAWSVVRRSFQQDGYQGWKRGRPEQDQPWLEQIDQFQRIGRPPPLVLIHGLGGKPSDWEDVTHGRDYRSFLAGNGYQSGWLWPYAYADYNFDGSYDADGDIRGVAGDLPSVVSRLRRLDQERGGNGEVDLLGFSLGGLIGRTYLQALAGDPGVRNYISLASPHLGVDWVNPWLEMKRWPRGSAIQQAIVVLVNELQNQRRNQLIDPDCPAVAQLSPTSQFIQWLNHEPAPDRVEYHLLYGDLRVKFSQQLFHLNLVSEEFQLGDLVVDPVSASSIPGIKAKLYPFRSEHQWRLVAGRLGEGWIYQLKVNWPELRYWHSSLPGQPEVKQTILEILKK